MPNRQDKRGRSRNPHGQFVLLPYSVIRSPAFRQLSGMAVRVLLELWTRYYGSNNGDLSLSLDDAANTLLMAKSTAKSAFDELVEHGFLRINVKGQWIKRHATTYSITLLKTSKAPATNDWKWWTPPEKPKRRRRAWGERKRKSFELIRNVAMVKTFPGSEFEPNFENTVPAPNAAASR